jgi:tetratricopeptide (TPR) repeat protein
MLLTQSRANLFALTLAILLPAGVAAQDHQHPAGDVAQLGRVEFPTSCAPAVAARFERAVAALHSFWFEAADSLFRDVLSADPECALAHWGRAMTAMGNPMTRMAPPPAVFTEGEAAAQRARDLSGSLPARERLYIDAAVAFYEGGPGHLDRMLALERAFEALHRAHPEDREAAIFFGRSLVANGAPDDRTFGRQLRAAELLEPLFAAHPQHPGLAHYLIHAYDAPPLAERGVDAARAYAAIAPAAPHALHMPSHIFTRLGHWDESIETNARSAQAEPDPDAAVHPMDYKVYAYLQQGRDAEARRVLDRAKQIPDRFYGGVMGYNFAAMPARYALERDDWREAAALRLPVGALPYVEAITRFARAVGAARSGAPEAQVAAELAALEQLKRQLDESGESEWSTRVEAQRLAAAAWALHARGETGEALRLAAAGADLEDTIEKHPVTPGPLLPARELKADLLLELGRHAEAQAEYEKTLEREPRRARALYGAARAAQQAGDTARARTHYTELLELLREADEARPELKAARQFLR